MSYHIPIISELVGGLEHFLFSHSVGNVIIPIDELIFFKGVGIPPTSYSFMYGVDVSKYASTMDHMGIIYQSYHSMG